MKEHDLYVNIKGLLHYADFIKSTVSGDKYIYIYIHVSNAVLSFLNIPTYALFFTQHSQYFSIHIATGYRFH